MRQQSVIPATKHATAVSDCQELRKPDVYAYLRLVTVMGSRVALEWVGLDLNSRI